MKDVIEVDLERIKNIINGFTKNEFSTIDVIREYSGGFYSNKNTAACYSFNAQFGKILQNNSNYLEITEIRTCENARDDNGNITSTTIWEKKIDK